MIKRYTALLLAVCMALCAAALPAAAVGSPLKPADEFDPVGHTFQNVHAAYMIEGGKASTTEFFTEAEFALHELTVINLWDSACLFCRLELPYFVEASEAYADWGVAVFGAVSTRMGGTYAAAYDYVLEYGVTYPNLIVDDGLAEIIYQNANTPQTFFVDSTGTVVGYVRGSVTYEELSALIESFMICAGDADESGEINFADVSSIYMYSLGNAELTPRGKANADVDGDGTVGFSDITVLYLSLIG